MRHESCDDGTDPFDPFKSVSDLITTDPFLFQHLKLPLQLGLALHFLLSSSHKHRLAVELCAVHVLHGLRGTRVLSEEAEHRLRCT